MGDAISEAPLQPGDQTIGYQFSLLLFIGAIAFLVLLYYGSRLRCMPRWARVNTVFVFWAVYILTRPLGAALGRAGQILPAASSTRILNPRFLSPMASYDVASDIRQALAVGDYIAQPVGDGGLGLTPEYTSVLFMAIIIMLVAYVTW